MTNQNPEPIVLTGAFEINAGVSTGDTELTHEMGSPEQMQLFAIYCYIYPGFLDIGSGNRTWTDIDPVYIPVVNNADRPNDSAGPQTFAALPVCCNPRPWTDVSLIVKIGNNPVPSKPINLGAVHAKYDRTLALSTPIKLKHSQRFYVNLTNNNPATAGVDTWTKLDLMFNGEVVNYEQLRLEAQSAAASK